MYFNHLASTLLKRYYDSLVGSTVIEHYELEREDIRVGFRIKGNYSGLMARVPKRKLSKWPDSRKKVGLFDFEIIATCWQFPLTHRNLFNEIINKSNLENVIKVWEGISPNEISKSDGENFVLLITSLMMFEQEVNWGNECWQKWTYFKPSIRYPTRIRPRDMLMGFVHQAFDKGVDNLRYWMTSKPGTVSFTEPGTFNSYKEYPLDLKGYFTDLLNSRSASALMTGEVLKDFKGLSDQFPINPLFG